MANDNAPANANTHQCICTRYAYSDRKLDGNPDYIMLANDDGVFVGMRVKTVGAARMLEKSGSLYFNTSGSLPTSTDLIPPADPSSPGWAFMKAR